MKDLFDKAGFRLRDSEKKEIWRRLAGAQRKPRRGRFILSPALATTAVTVAGLVIGMLLLQRDAALLRPVAEVTSKDVVQPPLRESTVPQETVLGKAESPKKALEPAAVDKRSNELAAAPAGPVERPTVASPVPDRREAAASRTPNRGAEIAEKADEAGNALTETETAGDRMQTMALAEEPPVAATGGAAADQLTDSDEREGEPALSGSTVEGRAVDRESGAPLPYVEIVIDGNPDATMPSWDGRFTLSGLAAGREHTIRLAHLGYEPRDTTVVLEHGKTVEIVFNLAPVIVETVAAFDVEGTIPQIKHKSAVAEQKLDADKFQKYAIDSVEDALSKSEGVVMRAGELYVRGGRSGERGAVVDDPLGGTRYRGLRAQPRERDADGRWRCPPPCPIWTPPNDEAFDAMYFQHYGVNPFIVTDEDALSTFAVDVDNASYTVTRRYLREGVLPPPEAVRVEEFVNFFDQDYGEVHGGDFAIRIDGAPSPFGAGYHLLRVGVQGRDIAQWDRKAAHLVFVIDTSGSMKRENRLGLVKRALHLLLDELDDGDTVGIVEYGSQGRVVLEPHGVEDRDRIAQAIDRLAPGGSTNAEEGLLLGYRMARQNYRSGAVNRLILCSDGVANRGRTGAESILDHVRRASDDDIHLSSIGFGMGNYNDELLEKLADQGDGNYYYVDDLKEAERVFRENLTGTLQTIARDVKIQVEFDPDAVLRWRLLGYENRDVADRDFRNDDVDAGEVGAGHVVTALYEVKLAGSAVRALRGDRGERRRSLGEVRLRYEVPEHERRAGRVREIAREILAEDISRSFERSSARLQLAGVVAEFAEILRGSYWAKGSRLSDLVPMARQLARDLQDDRDVAEFADLVRRAAALQHDDDEWERE